MATVPPVVTNANINGGVREEAEEVNLDDKIDNGSDEKQAIQNANSSPSRDEELRLMKVGYNGWFAQLIEL